MPRAPCVYILANRRQGTLYTGVTSNLAQRIFQHRDGMTPGFATRYGCNRLVFYEAYERMDEAIASYVRRNFNLLIGGSALDPVSGTASHRAYLCDVRPLR